MLANPALGYNPSWLIDCDGRNLCVVSQFCDVRRKHLGIGAQVGDVAQAYRGGEAVGLVAFVSGSRQFRGEALDFGLLLQGARRLPFS